ncbi:FecR family protein [Agriterribacter sp.]|uniref:FecR family protein n=1 Tax=Agriterribacter sp. TaxID=2821509 RepID=UPI002C0572C5|nr:FecR domain-containing protein [Agriterribacter sp.]HTN09170.1 FecR domain-containing protein [Agriterribacter sp.]
MFQSRLAYLFTTYINKAHTPEEKAELFRLIEAEGLDSELRDLLDEMISNTEAEMLLPEKSGDIILQSIIGNQARHAVKLPVHDRKKITSVWRNIAAASVILIGLLAYFIFPVNRNGEADGAGNLMDGNFSELLVSTTTGERKNIQLADGTQVWLSPSSKIEYPASFRGGLREIKLSGEAFFEVAHDADHPFIIHSGNIETKVLGTSFNIQAYDNQEEIAVMVVTGSVNVANTDKIENVELIANQRAVFHRNTTELVKENTNAVDAPNMLKRKEGMFVYKNERLQKLIDDLQEYFGIGIQVDQTIKECKVTANFYITDDLRDILEPIAIMVNGNFHKSNNEFVIEGKGCPE